MDCRVPNRQITMSDSKWGNVVLWKGIKWNSTGYSPWSTTFIVYINDILDNVHSEGLLFVDDTKIFRAITKKDDAEALPLDIESLYQWSQSWGMEFGN